MMAVSPIEHSRTVRFPRGYVVTTDNALALLGAAEESRDDSMLPVSWQLQGRDWSLRGHGSHDFLQAVERLPGEVIDMGFSTGRYGSSETDRHLMLIAGSRLSVKISGHERDWVAGTKERLDAVVRETFRPSLTRRWHSLPILAIALVAAWAAAGGLSAILQPQAALPARLLGVTLVMWLYLSWLQFAPEYSLRISAKDGRAALHWYQAPIVEGGRTVALFIGAVWAVVQIAQWVMIALAGE